ncbi:MAG: hypothetical protein OQK75_10395 [Gammaproteobacteria bacterium]|nr:hypothetical protein [Gammaproteobacteria bacterium]MCW8988060.1 hypothetical protein [Gammaproteobacteria bacterium]
MSFFFQTINIPAWFIVFILASATPLWFKWYLKFHKKFIRSGVLLKKFKRAKSTAEMKMDVLKKATDHFNANSQLSNHIDGTVKKRKAVKKDIDPVKKQNIRTVLKVLAEAGDKGILPKSISDKSGINLNGISSALKYLIEKNYAEVINASYGAKYYLTTLGKKYCINKKYI